jgi:hypothetical protein
VLDRTTHIDEIISIIPEAQLMAVAENEVFTPILLREFA